MPDPSWHTVRLAWLKTLVDASGTRQQITLVVLVAWAVIVYRGYTLLKTATEATKMLEAITPVVIATVGAWFAGRWLAYNYDEKRRE